MKITGFVLGSFSVGLLALAVSVAQDTTPPPDTSGTQPAAQQPATKPAGLLAAGSVAAVYGLGLLLLSAVYGLSTVIVPWAAALIVGAVVLAVAGILLSVARGGFRKITPPEKTIQSVKENVTWLKDQIR